MGAYDSLKSLVRQYIKTNGQNEITGQILQNVLIAMIDDLGITIDPTPTKNSSDAVASGGAFDMIQDATNVNAIESVDGKIYNDYQAGDIFFIVDNNVRKYRVALVAGTADSEHPVTISPVNFYYALNSADAINLSLTLKTVSTEQQSLSAQQKAQARTNIAAVSYEQQSLSDAQRVQAQNNMMGKSYVPSQNSGLGKVYLDKNNGVLTQAMISADNTVYVIQYDYTLEANITIPTGSILQFDGGRINGNGSGKNTITGQASQIIGNGFNTSINLAGTWLTDLTPEMFGTCGTADDSTILNHAVTQAINISVNLCCRNAYNVGSSINIDRPVDGLNFNFRIYGGGVFNIAANTTLFSSSIVGAQAVSQYVVFDSLQFYGKTTSYVASEKLLRISFDKCFFKCRCANSTGYLQSWYFSQCTISSGGDGTCNDAWLKAANCYDITIVSCAGDAGNRIKTFVDLQDASKLSITDTLIEGFFGDAVILRSGCAGKISGCYFEGNGGQTRKQSGLYDITLLNSTMLIDGNYFYNFSSTEIIYAVKVIGNGAQCVVKSIGNYFVGGGYFTDGRGLVSLSTNDRCSLQDSLALCDQKRFQNKIYYGAITASGMNVGFITAYAGIINEGDIIFNTENNSILYAKCISGGTYDTAQFTYVENPRFLSTTLADGVDLNNIRVPGLYTTATNNWGTGDLPFTLTNAPEQKYGMLKVEGEQSYAITQTYTIPAINANEFKVYMRSYYAYGGQWSPWVLITNVATT